MTDETHNGESLNAAPIDADAGTKHYDPYINAGVMWGPNACRRCEKWFAPYGVAVLKEDADAYCWGHQVEDALVDSGLRYCVQHHGYLNEDDMVCDFARIDVANRCADDPGECAPVRLFYLAADIGGDTHDLG